MKSGQIPAQGKNEGMAYLETGNRLWEGFMNFYIE